MKKLAMATGILLMVVVTAVGVRPSGADQHEPPPISVELLTPRSAFTDDVRAQIRFKLDGRRTTVLNSTDPSRIAVAKITVQPGARFPWHTHPGPVFVNVAEGELTYVNAADCVPRRYAAGTAFVDPGRGNLHTAYGSSAGITVLYAFFLEAPVEGPLTITDGLAAPDDCDVEPGPHGGH